MLLKNVSRRLITINMPVKELDKKGNEITKMKGVQIKPGDNPAVDVPDEICKYAFVKNLIKDGSLSIMMDDDDEEAPSDDLEGKTKAELLEIAKMIDPDASGTKAQLTAIIRGGTE